MIELHFSNGKVITEETNHLPLIANSYFEQSTQRLQDHINNTDIKNALSEIGIFNLEVCTYRRVTYLEKMYLSLTCDVASEEAVQTLLHVLGTSKIKNLQLKDKQLAFSINEVQRIDSFVNRPSHTMWHHQPITSSDKKTTLQVVSMHLST